MTNNLNSKQPKFAAILTIRNGYRFSRFSSTFISVITKMRVLNSYSFYITTTFLSIIFFVSALIDRALIDYVTIYCEYMFTFNVKEL